MVASPGVSFSSRISACKKRLAKIARDALPAALVTTAAAACLKFPQIPVTVVHLASQISPKTYIHLAIAAILSKYRPKGDSVRDLTIRIAMDTLYFANFVELGLGLDTGSVSSKMVASATNTVIKRIVLSPQTLLIIGFACALIRNFGPDAAVVK